jgi:hypothetical protein
VATTGITSNGFPPPPPPAHNTPSKRHRINSMIKIGYLEIIVQEQVRKGVFTTGVKLIMNLSIVRINWNNKTLLILILLSPCN